MDAAFLLDIRAQLDGARSTLPSVDTIRLLVNEVERLQRDALCPGDTFVMTRALIGDDSRVARVRFRKIDRYDDAALLTVERVDDPLPFDLTVIVRAAMEKVLDGLTPDVCGRIMHEAWTRTKRSQGFHGPKEPCGLNCHIPPAPLSDIRCGHVHADLIPWEQLPDGQKAVNRAGVVALVREIHRRARPTDPLPSPAGQ